MNQRIALSEKQFSMLMESKNDIFVKFENAAIERKSKEENIK